jgi:hypothetical protein
MRLVFCVEEGVERKIRAAIAGLHCGRFIESGEIAIWPIVERRRLVFNQNFALVQPGDVFVRSKGVFLSELESFTGCTVIEKSISALINTRALKNLLADHGFSWERSSLREVSKWHHHACSLSYIREWVDQFRVIGRPDIGKRLVTGLRVIAPAELKTRFPLAELRLEPERRAAVLSGIDESGGTLAHLIRQDISKDVQALENIFSDGSDFVGAVDVFEDALWTGSQVISALERRMLSTTQAKFRRSEIVLRFGIRTDLGCCAVKSYLAANTLNNVSIANSGDYFQVLSPASIAAFDCGTCGFKEVMDFHQMTVAANPLVFQPNGPFHDCSANGAEALLRNIGTQLWKNWAASKDGRCWDDEQIARCGLGANGIGGHIIFSHTSPTASLPLLWGSGNYAVNSQPRIWKPLFPRG